MDQRPGKSQVIRLAVSTFRTNSANSFSRLHREKLPSCRAPLDIIRACLTGDKVAAARELSVFVRPILARIHLTKRCEPSFSIESRTTRSVVGEHGQRRWEPGA